MMRHILTTVLILFVLIGNGFAQDDLLKKVPQLQATARRANDGELGCGEGPVTLITSRGQIEARAGSDTFRVFGHTIRVSDLLVLLEARAESNRTGVVNPMSGEVSDLAYVALTTLALAKDPVSISVIAELLKDKDDGIRGCAALALYEIAQSSEELQTEIRKIKFPQAAIDSGKAMGVKPPVWVQITPGV
ncbi:MAG: HEAT repeat domain-containing protein [Pyrinomonadaceae bacterium]